MIRKIFLQYRIVDLMEKTHIDKSQHKKKKKKIKNFEDDLKKFPP